MRMSRSVMAFRNGLALKFLSLRFPITVGPHTLSVSPSLSQVNRTMKHLTGHAMGHKQISALKRAVVGKALAPVKPSPLEKIYRKIGAR